jgi:NAD(P)H dehydrogenase (quinone)
MAIRSFGALAVLNRADAMLFSAPTYMGSAGGLFKLFMEATFDLWFEQRWKDKVASGFANSASQRGDKLSVLLQFTIFAAQHGMIWAPHRATIGRAAAGTTSTAPARGSAQ